MCRSGVPPKSILFWIFAKWRQSTLFSAGALWVRQVILGQYTTIDECSRLGLSNQVQQASDLVQLAKNTSLGVL